MMKNTEEFQDVVKALIDEKGEKWAVALVPPRNVFRIYRDGEEIIELPFYLSRLFFRHVKCVENNVRAEIRRALGIEDMEKNE